GRALERLLGRVRRLAQRAGLGGAPRRHGRADAGRSLLRRAAGEAVRDRDHAAPATAARRGAARRAALGRDAPRMPRHRRPRRDPHGDLSRPAAVEEPGMVLALVTVVASTPARAVDAWGQRVGRPVGQDDREPLTWALVERGRATSAPDLLAAIEYVHAFGRR